MKLPRRVPWASVSELEQLCSWIYADENDLEAKILATNRLSAWKAITSLPHALDAALSLLVAIIQDSSQSTTSHLILRQNYATAIIRLVNGLVDPLQLGAYARSIASIANQLGLPSWLVELRHAATHEELPSLELLRQAARESMVWILHNYFLPTINPPLASEMRVPPLRPLMPVLKQYKTLLKSITRDASLKSRYKADITNVMRDTERWIAEAKVAANIATGEVGWDDGGVSHRVTTTTKDMDTKERWALDKLCDELLEKGALVPLAKKKRELPQGQLTPPRMATLIWAPLLQHLGALHSNFFAVLSTRIVSQICADYDRSENQPDPTYDACLAAWAKWCLEEWDKEGAARELELTKEITTMLLRSLSSGTVPMQSKKGAAALLKNLCVGNTRLETIYSSLVSVSNNVASQNWNTEDMKVIQRRLEACKSMTSTTPATAHPSMTIETVLESHAAGESIAGWRFLDKRTGWSHCPIGVHCTTVS